MRKSKLDNTVMTHAVTQMNITDTDISRQLEELAIKGYTLVDSGLTDIELQDARQKLDAIYDTQVSEVGGEENMKLINDAGIARAACAYDPLFLKIATLPQILKLSDAFLQQYFVLMSQNGILNKAKEEHYQFTWHRDLNYQHYISSKPLALSALLAIDPFDDVTGGTYVLPGTHLKEACPSKNYILNNQEVVKCPAGTIIFFDSMLFHRTGKNTSNSVRRAVNHIIVSAMIRQQYDFKSIFKDMGVEVKDEMHQKYFGYEYDVPTSIKKWRTQKLNKVRLIDKQ